MPKRQKTATKAPARRILVAVGNILRGFEFFGPFPMPSNEKQLSEVKSEVIVRRGHFGKNDPPFMIVDLWPAKDAQTAGDWFVLAGTWNLGFSAHGPFVTEEEARSFAKSSRWPAICERSLSCDSPTIRFVLQKHDTSIKAVPPYETIECADLTTIAHLRASLEAILARIDGNFDHPALMEYGALTVDKDVDISRIVRTALGIS